MSPLRIEVFNEVNQEWIETRKFNPTDSPDYVPYSNPNEEGEIYLAECKPDDSKSIIYSVSPWIEDPKELAKASPFLADRSKFVTVQEIRDGDKPFEMDIKTDKDSETRRFRFTHEKGL